MAEKRTIEAEFGEEKFQLRLRMRDFMALTKAMETTDLMEAMSICLRAEHIKESTQVADLIEECPGENVKEQLAYIQKLIEDVLELAGFASKDADADPNEPGVAG